MMQYSPYSNMSMQPEVWTLNHAHCAAGCRAARNRRQPLRTERLLRERTSHLRAPPTSPATPASTRLLLL